MIYFAIQKYYLNYFRTYPFEVLTDVVFRFVIILLHSYFLYLVVGDSTISTQTIIAYFLVADGLVGIVMSQWGDLSTIIGRSVRDGTLNNFLLRPIKIIPYLYAVSFGTNIISRFLQFLQIILGILLTTDVTLTGALLFIPWIFIAICIGLAINILDSVTAIYMIDNSAFRSGFYHFVRIFSGSLIPLYLFPTYLYEIIKYSPFPMMIYYPTNVLRTESVGNEEIQLLIAGFIWVIVLLFGSYFLWRRALQSYDAVGA